MSEARTPPLQNPIEKHFKKVTRYHIYFFCLYFASKFLSVWHTLNIIFLSPPMTYTCGVDKTKNMCPCNNPEWDFSMFSKTTQTKFGLICEKIYLVGLSESISFFGLLVGSLMFGFLSDRFGRLLMYCLCLFVVGLSGLMVPFMPSIALFCFVRFFEGVGSGGAIVTGFVLCVEFCGTSYRATISSLLHFPGNIGLIALAGVSYLLRNCDHFQMAVSIPLFFFVPLKCLLLESPKWLIDQNRKEETIQVMEKFCRFNKTPCETIRSDIETYISSRTSTGVEQIKFIQIFKYKRHTRNFLCMAYLCFICGLSYYGISQFIGKMSQHVHLNTVANGVLLLAGTLSCIFLINRIGRKPYLAINLFAAGSCMLIVVVIPNQYKHSWFRIMFACFSSSFYYVAFIIVFLFGVELFPTNIRSSTLGVLALSSRVGQVIGPILNSFSPTLAGSVFSSLAIIGGIVALFLPETRGVQLPSTLEEEATRRVTFNPQTIDKDNTEIPQR